MSRVIHPTPVSLDSVTPDIWNANSAQCKLLIDNETNWQSIPLFNYIPTENVKNHQFVRFRGMIQNMHNPEFYLSKYEVRNAITGASTVRSGKLRNTVVCQETERLVEDSEHNETSERNSWLCVPIPALNDWVSVSWKKPYLKRHHDRSEGEEPVKKTLNDVQSSQQSCTSDAESLQLTLPEPRSRMCALKLYDFDTASYVLNDVIEVAGFVSFFNDIDEEEFGMEDAPNAKVPQLHVVACKNLSQHSSLLPEVLLGAATDDMQSARNDLHLVFTQLLLGDTMAAEYLVCHLLSCVYSRTDMMALGQLPLNIINVPKSNYVKNLYNIIELLVVKSMFLPLSLEFLNRRKFNPKKDYEQDQLGESVLQLSPHTHLILDETQMQPGKLETLGVMNMTALRKLVLEQKVAYDFQYYHLDFNCDLPVLVLSEGKSLLPCSIVVPLETDATCLENIPEIFQAAHHFLQPPMVHRLRAYILSAQSASCTISSEMQQIIQDDFVKLRQNKEIDASADDLHNLMVLARLQSLSVGELTLTAKTWEKTLNLEMQRKERLGVLKRT